MPSESPPKAKVVPTAHLRRFIGEDRIEGKGWAAMQEQPSHPKPLSWRASYGRRTEGPPVKVSRELRCAGLSPLPKTVACCRSLDPKASRFMTGHGPAQALLSVRSHDKEGLRDNLAALGVVANTRLMPN